jgi:hypothetical protein
VEQSDVSFISSSVEYIKSAYEWINPLDAMFLNLRNVMCDVFLTAIIWRHSIHATLR